MQDNWNHRGPIEPKGILIHSMGEYIGGVYCTDFLQSLKFPLSAHAFITPDAEVIEAAPTPMKAFHAGKSEWGALKNLNNHFLGIEIMVRGDHNLQSFYKAIKKPESFSHDVLMATVNLCAKWMEMYEIPIEMVLRHSDVSGSDVRPDPKHDPGEGFDWFGFKNTLIMKTALI